MFCLGNICGIVDFCSKKKGKYMHTKKMKCNAVYRLVYSSKTIYSLLVWQKYADKLTHEECAILQIAEANDLPYEIWRDLNTNQADMFQPLSALVGTVDHDAQKCSQLALEYYISKLAIYSNLSLSKAKEYAKSMIDSKGIQFTHPYFDEVVLQPVQENEGAEGAEGVAAVTAYAINIEVDKPSHA